MAKRSPEQVWKALEKEAFDDELEFQRACNMSTAEAEKELASMGLDPKAEREKASAWRREIEERVAARKRKEMLDGERVRAMRPERARPRPALLWLVAATVGAAVGGGVVYMTMHREPPPAPVPPLPSPEPSPAPVAPPAPDLVATAADYRRDAVAECNEGKWAECLADLDAARALDPAGDLTPDIKLTRQRAMKGILADKPPKPMKPPVP
jgi:hypothetical protein